MFRFSPLLPCLISQVKCLHLRSLRIRQLDLENMCLNRLSLFESLWISLNLFESFWISLNLLRSSMSRAKSSWKAGIKSPYSRNVIHLRNKHQYELTIFGFTTLYKNQSISSSAARCENMVLIWILAQCHFFLDFGCVFGLATAPVSPTIMSWSGKGSFPPFD